MRGSLARATEIAAPILNVVLDLRLVPGVQLYPPDAPVTNAMRLVRSFMAVRA